ncbi:purine-nucleoside phosphorylase [bacterium]|nr:purine-nucleoside phosphorylase [bacterium]
MNHTADRLLQKADFKPRWIIELGSGFSSVMKTIPSKNHIPYSELSDFQIPTTPGHAGVVSFLSGSNGGAYIFSGRSHYYEEVESQKTTLIVRIAKELDVEGVLFCSACGSIDYNLQVGDLILFTDALRFPLFSFSRSPEKDSSEFGNSFINKSRWFDEEFSNFIAATALRAGIFLNKGVIALVPGPNYETISEVRALRKLGASAVTMSCEPALKLACKLGVKTAMLGGITNPAAGVNYSQVISHNDVLEVGEDILSPMLQRLVSNLVGK